MYQALVLLDDLKASDLEALLAGWLLAGEKVRGVSVTSPGPTSGLEGIRSGGIASLLAAGW